MMTTTINLYVAAKSSSYSYLSVVCKDASDAENRNRKDTSFSECDWDMAPEGMKKVLLSSEYDRVIRKIEYRIENNGEKHGIYLAENFWAEKLKQGNPPSTVKDFVLVEQAYFRFLGEEASLEDVLSFIVKNHFFEFNSKLQFDFARGRLQNLCPECEKYIWGAGTRECDCGQYSKTPQMNVLFRLCMQNGFHFVSKQSGDGQTEYVYENNNGDQKKVVRKWFSSDSDSDFCWIE